MNAIILKHSNKRLVAAFLDGRKHGLAACREAIEAAERAIAQARTDRAQLQDQVEHLKRRYELACEILRRADAINAMRERCDASVTLH
jgi:hypothetical protein